jgi:hypothetical protein
VGVRIAAAAAVVLALTSRAYADDDLARAHQLEAALEYEQALTLVDSILARGGADPVRFVELHVLAGRLAAGLERPQIAEDHFARALAVQPQTALPEGTSPKLTAPFDAARTRAQPLRVEATMDGDAIVITAQDPLAIVIGIAVTVVDAVKTRRDVVERGALRAMVPDGVRAVRVAALDANGNRVWEGPAPALGLITDRPLPTREAPFYARTSTWAIATTLVLAGAGISAWRFDAYQREWNRLHDAGTVDFSDLETIETRGRRWALAANIGFGLALAGGITTGIVWLRHRSSPVVVAPSPTGVGVAGRF